MTPGGGWQPRADPPPLDRASLPRSLVRLLALRWQQLCEDERDSVIGATLAATDLARLGAPAAILGAAARVIEDEVRHVEVCARVLDRLGAEPFQGSPAARRATLGSEAAIDARCARALVAGFAVSEPMSAACFALARRHAKEPLFSLGADGAASRRSPPRAVRDRRRRMGHPGMVRRPATRAMAGLRRRDGALRAAARRTDRG